MSRGPAILTTRTFQPKFAFWALGVHLAGFILLPLYFSWSNLALAFFGAALTAYSLGIFHHMYLSHSSFEARPWVAKLGVLLATLTWRGPMAAPLRYVALHRVHHAYSDRDSDPHSPVHGVFHSLLGWNWNFAPVFAHQHQYLRWAGRHAKDPFFLFLDSNVHLLQLTWGVALFAAGGLLGEGAFDWQNAMGWMAYGVFGKTLLVIYLANMVDVINHGPGYRNYETSDRSTNSLLMSMVHLGGAISWHNNHHARPGYFSVKKQWWEFDMHLALLRALEKLGLVWKIKVLDESEPKNSLDESEPKPEPKLTDFLQQSKALAARMILARLGQFLLPFVAYLSLPRDSAWSLAALAALAPVAAIGLHNLGLLGHEGTHFNLTENKLTSSLLGTLFASMVPFHFNTGFALSHAAHHAFTNTEKDPDLHLFGSFRGLGRRLLGARRAASLAYFRGTLAAAFGAAAGAQLPGLTRAELRKLALFNLVASAFFLALYAGIGLKLGAPFWLFFACVYALAYLLSAARPYLEHAGTDHGKFTSARTFSSRLLDLAFGGINYHLAHHLYPKVPAYRAAEFHRWLSSQESFRRQARIEESDLGRLSAALAGSPYGQAS